MSKAVIYTPIRSVTGRIERVVDAAGNVIVNHRAVVGEYVSDADLAARRAARRAADADRAARDAARRAERAAQHAADLAALPDLVERMNNQVMTAAAIRAARAALSKATLKADAALADVDMTGTNDREYGQLVALAQAAANERDRAAAHLAALTGHSPARQDVAPARPRATARMRGMARKAAAPTAADKAAAALGDPSATDPKLAALRATLRAVREADEARQARAAREYGPDTPSRVDAAHEVDAITELLGLATPAVTSRQQARDMRRAAVHAARQGRPADRAALGRDMADGLRTMRWAGQTAQYVRVSKLEEERSHLDGGRAYGTTGTGVRPAVYVGDALMTRKRNRLPVSVRPTLVPADMTWTQHGRPLMVQGTAVPGAVRDDSADGPVTAAILATLPPGTRIRRWAETFARQATGDPLTADEIAAAGGDHGRAYRVRATALVRADWLAASGLDRHAVADVIVRVAYRCERQHARRAEAADVAAKRAAERAARLAREGSFA